MNRLVSIITATYNNAAFLAETIDSVLKQSITNWEWIIVNNGSSDNTNILLAQIHDPRIRIIELEKNMGVSGGRNIGIQNSYGEFICFLDGDDLLPQNSLESRLKIFEKNQSIEFVDGKVISFKDRPENQLEEYLPKFSGNPLDRLLSLDATVFKGNTWMIKRVSDKQYAFNTQITHGEELLFYAQIAYSGTYDYTNDPILYYRRHNQSAMTNLNALATGYFQIAKELSNLGFISNSMLAGYKKKAASIVFKSFLAQGKPLGAVKYWLKLMSS